MLLHRKQLMIHSSHEWDPWEEHKHADSDLRAAHQIRGTEILVQDWLCCWTRREASMRGRVRGAVTAFW